MFGIRWHRVKAIVIRALYAERRNITRISETFYWPFLDIVIWGFLGTWVQNQQASGVSIQALILVALVFWEVILRTNVEITSTILEEIWSHSLLNLFASPITLKEWIVALMISGVMKALITFAFSALLLTMFFNLSIGLLGWTLPLFFILLFLVGLSIGFLGAGFIIYAGHRLESLSWQIAWSFAPLSTVFYPLEALPSWLQTLAQIFPMVYIFESMRTVLETHKVPFAALGWSFLLTLAYLGLSICFFMAMFEKSRLRGLGRLG